MTKYIDITPSWSDITPALLKILEDPESMGKSAVRDELIKMAKVADFWVSHCKQHRETNK